MDDVFRIAPQKILPVNEIVQLLGHFGRDDLEELSMSLDLYGHSCF